MFDVNFVTKFVNANIKEKLERKVESISHKIYQKIDVNYLKKR